MAAPQPGGVLNFLLLVLFAGGGWIFAAWTKEPGQSQPVLASGSGTSRNQPGVFAADGRAVLTQENGGAGKFDELTARYGSGSGELHALAFPLLEKWAAAQPAEAAAAGLERCLNHTPDLMPHFLAALAAQEKCEAAKLLAAVPAGPLREPALAALAESLGRHGRAELHQGLTALTRGERSLFLRQWHRGRGLNDAAAAGQSAGALTDADDRAAAASGVFLARAEKEPEAVLSEAVTRDDYPEIAAAAFRAWLPRETTAAWRFVASQKGDARLPELCAALLEAEIPRRRFGGILPEIQSLLARHFPDGPPPEVLEVVIPVLASESPLAAQKFAESVSGTGSPDNLRTSARVVLFDAFCATDPAAAWRLTEAIVQKEGAKDGRAVHSWTTAVSRGAATPEQRLAAGFPDFTDMTQLALGWLANDPAAAISTFAAPGVQAPLQRLVVEAALSSKGAAIPLTQLLEWARLQPAHIPHTIEAVAKDK